MISGERYGYGSVTVFDKYSLAARLLIKSCRPWEEIHFDDDCRATEDFDVLLLGFGQYNQNILKELVRNGQFCGSEFHATVISSDCSKTAGSLQNECRAMFDTYDIRMIEEDARSVYTFDFIQKNSDKIKFIVIAIGKEKDSREIADQIKAMLDDRKRKIPIVCCSDEGILYQESCSEELKKYPLYTMETMDFRIADQLAMEVNHTYSSNPDGSEWEEWMACDYYSRMNSRASADFIPAMLWSMHLRSSDVKKFDAFHVSKDGTSDRKNGVLSKAQADNLGRTEHVRWCAFQYTMGFSPMRPEEWESRAELYRQQVKDGTEKKIRLGRDMDTKQHICLTSMGRFTRIIGAGEGSDRETRRLSADRYQQCPCHAEGTAYERSI